MRNGYFQLVSVMSGGYGIKFFPPVEEGKAVGIGEVAAWLEKQKISYDLGSVKQFLESGKEITCLLGRGDCPVLNETYQITVDDNHMLATVRFYPPSEGGARLSFNEFLSDLRFENITYGIQLSELQDHFQSPGIYCTDLLVARGKEPRQGTDARIEYNFNTDLHVRPALRDDGSVDYFNLNVINHCHKGEVLARMIPADEGEYGINISGGRLKPREVKQARFKYGNHVELSEDGMEIRSAVDGHVMLVDDKVFVSDVYEVENVDTSTGNIEFEGSVQINGNVASNFVVRASGNVIIDGVVEGAHIYAGGNITIARGMNGMGKGTLQAGGNIVAKFIESAHVSAENGYVSTESILHSEVSAGDEVIVQGKKGFVTGGHVRAAHRVVVKTLGAVMGAPTIVEVGVEAKLKEDYINLQKDITELSRRVQSAQPVLVSFAERRAMGVHFTPEQIASIMETVKEMEMNKRLLEDKNRQLEDMKPSVELQRSASVEVTGEVYPGTTIMIGDVSMTVQTAYSYCKFMRIMGEIKMAPL